jgi:two-component system chemotaxis sensor kinase CheA
MSGTDPALIYRQEAAELLEQLEQALLDLEHTPGDADLVNTAFRALHTIKGSGAMFGFDAVAAFTHHVETAFDRVRKGEVAASASLIAVTLAAKDHIRRLIEQPDSASEAEGAAILDRLQAALVAPADSTPADVAAVTWRLRFRLPPDAVAMGTNAGDHRWAADQGGRGSLRHSAVRHRGMC